MISKQNKFIAAIALQVVILLVIILFKASVAISGTEVLLKIKPVDPRDLLRGDYITFQYDISDLNFNQVYGMDIENGQTVYAVLEPGEKYASVRYIQIRKPNTKDIFIKGAIQSGGLKEGENEIPFERDRMLHIIYGIEQYFIPEGSGRNESFWQKDAYAKVSVDDNGNAVIKQIYVDGKKWPQ